MKPRILAFSTATLLLVSCAKTSKVELGEQMNPVGPTGKPLIRTNNKSDAGTPVAPGGNATPNPAAAGIAITPEEETVYTNMDDPEAEIPELSEVLDSAPKRQGPWEMSETIAKQRAIHEGKPLLIWFTDSKTSPMCKALSQELFNRQDFSDWANEKLVRLKVDSNFDDNDYVKDPDIDIREKESRRAVSRNYVTNLKKRYKVLGAPVLLLLNPSGEVIGRYRGYKRGESDYTWGLIKQGEASSAAAYDSWKSGLVKKGYRDWSDRKGRKVFAKLTAYSKGTLTLIQPDGTRCKTQESKLCDDDQNWINEQKKLRGL